MKTEKHAYTISVLQSKKVFSRSLLFTFRKTFVYISFDLQTVCLNCLIISWKQKNFLKNSHGNRKVDFPEYPIGSSSKPSLTSITSSSPPLILPISKYSANTSESVSGGCIEKASASTSVNETALTSSGTRSGWRFRKASISFCKSSND